MSDAKRTRKADKAEKIELITPMLGAVVPESLKARLCRHFVRRGTCKYEDKCRHIHWTKNPLRYWLLERGHVDFQIHRFVGVAKLEEVDDLAFAFTTAEEASAAGAAAAWEDANEASRPSLFAASLVLQHTIEEGILRGPRVPAPKCRPSNPRRQPAPPRQKALKEIGDSDPQRRLCIVHLTSLARGWGVPEQDALLLGQAVEQAGTEVSFINNVLRVYEKQYIPFCKEHKLDPLNIENVHLKQFFYSSVASTVPRMRFDALNFLHKRFRLPVSCDPVIKPPTHTKGDDDENQAVPVEPEVIKRIERIVPVLHSQGSWLLGAALGALLLFYGTIRFVHAQRSKLLFRETSVITASCYKGKAKTDGRRMAFRFRIPLCPSMELLWTLWNTMCRTTRTAQTYLIFDHTTSLPFNLSTFTEAVREVCRLAHAVTNVEVVTSYSFRRASATMAGAWEAPWQARMALGAWKEAVRESKDNTFHSLMPSRYDGCKDESESYVKCLHVSMLEEAYKYKEPLTWALFRAWFRDKNFDEQREDMSRRIAHSLDEKEVCTPAFDAADVVHKKIGRRIIIPALPSASSSDAMPKGVVIESSSSESSSPVSSPREEASVHRGNRGDFPWAFKKGNNTVIHFLDPLSTEEPHPLCSRFPLLDIDSEGTDVVVAASLGRDFCKLCLKRVAPETVETIDRARRLL